MLQKLQKTDITPDNQIQKLLQEIITKLEEVRIESEHKRGPFNVLEPWQTGYNSALDRAIEIIKKYGVEK